MRRKRQKQKITIDWKTVNNPPRAWHWETNDLYLILIFIGVIGLMINDWRKDYLLKTVGKCSKGILTDHEIRHKTQPTTLYYEFKYNGITYMEDSYVTDLTKAGDSLCVVYLEDDPGINKALNRIDEDSRPCDCK
jgi:hypothetical protein